MTGTSHCHHIVSLLRSLYCLPVFVPLTLAPFKVHLLVHRAPGPRCSPLMAEIISEALLWVQYILDTGQLSLGAGVYRWGPETLDRFPKRFICIFCFYFVWPLGGGIAIIKV